MLTCSSSGYHDSGQSIDFGSESMYSVIRSRRYSKYSASKSIGVSVILRLKMGQAAQFNVLKLPVTELNELDILQHIARANQQFSRDTNQDFA